MNSDHTIVQTHSCLHLDGRRKATSRKPLGVQLNDEKVKDIIQEQLENELISRKNDTLEIARYDIQKAVETVVISTSK